MNTLGFQIVLKTGYVIPVLDKESMLGFLVVNVEEQYKATTEVSVVMSVIHGFI